MKRTIRAARQITPGLNPWAAGEMTARLRGRGKKCAFSAPAQAGSLPFLAQDFSPGLAELLGLFLFLSCLLLGRPAHANKDDDLWIECRYIAQCSYSPSNSAVTKLDTRLSGYGALNDWRIGNGRADFVRPGESAIGAIGLLVGYHQLLKDRRSNPELDLRARAALGDFFGHWVVNPANQVDKSSPGHPRVGFPAQVAYSDTGRMTSKDTDANVGVSAEMLMAMGKYVTLSPNGDGAAYRHRQYGLAHRLADYINDKIGGGDGLVHDNYGNAYTADNAYAVAAFHGFARWARAEHDAKTGTYYDAQAGKVSAALVTLQDHGPWGNYFRYKDSATGKGSYGGIVDQTGFAPYEFDARPAGEPYVKRVADWWDHGASWHQPLAQLKGLYAGGVHQQDYQSDRTYRATPNARFLYPGVSFQLAAAEWKIARAAGSKDLTARARSHYDFARRNGFWNADKHLDAFIGGFNDWVNPQTGAQQTETYKRFIDTSAYFIIATEMFEFGQDVDFGR